MERRVRIYDATLYDGLERFGVCLTPREKVELTERIEAAGVTTIEVSCPGESPQDLQAVREAAAALNRCEVAARARCICADIEAAGNAVNRAARPVINVCLPVSDARLRDAFGMTRADAVRAIPSGIALARRFVEAVQFTAEDAARAERPFLRQCVAAAVEAGATRIAVSDAPNGTDAADEYAERIGDVRRFAGPDAILSTRASTPVRVAAAVRVGARQIETTLLEQGARWNAAGLRETVRALPPEIVAEMDMDWEEVTAAEALALQLMRPPRGRRSAAEDASGVTPRTSTSPGRYARMHGIAVLHPADVYML